MIKQCRLATLLLSLALICSACSTPLKKTSPEELAGWVEAGEFSKAYLAIADDKVEILPASKEEKLQELEKQSTAEWAEIKKSAQALLEEQQWKRAKEQLNTAIDQLIDPEEAEASMASLLKSEEDSLYTLRVDEAITRGRWLEADYQLQLKIKESTHSNILTPIIIQQLKSKQQTLAEELLLYAEQALENKDIKRAKSCHRVLKKIIVPEKLMANVDKLGNQLSQNKKDTLLNKQKALASKLDKSMKDGQLVDATQQIARLKRLKPLPKSILMKIDAVNSVLSYNAEFLNEKAEDYYRDGNLELASSIWEYLVRLDPSRDDIKLKLSRSEKVLKNMQELRKSGHRAVN